MQILCWIARHGVVTPELVGRRFFWRPDRGTYGQWAAYRRIRVLRDLGLLVGNKPYAHHPEVLRLTGEGARLADVGLRPAPLVLSELRHTLAVVTLAEYLLASHPGAALTTERELRAQAYRQRYSGADYPGHVHVPDALLRIPAALSAGRGETAVALELDLSRKDRRAMQTLILSYDRVPVHMVWWYVKPVRLERVRTLVAELGAEDRIKVLPWPG